MTTTPVTLTSRQAVHERGLTYAEALANPCTSCDETPCCSYLPVRTFQVATLMDLDYVRYLLNFDAVAVGLSSSGDWSAYVRRSCRNLDPATKGCRVHGTVQQPSVCRHYNPYTCWYRSAMLPVASPDFVLVDDRRLDVVLELVRFDHRRHVEAMPDWATLQERFAALPIDDAPAPAPEVDAVLLRWQRAVLDEVPVTLRSVVAADDPRQGTACAGCAAACCDTVVFPLVVPATAASVDFLRFSLGFPGVELGIGESAWTIAVKTRCRHLVGDRCGLYGQAERPLTCSYLDANHCTFKPGYTQTRPPALVRVGLEQLAWVEELFELDELGAVVRAPTLDEVRAAVESRWRAHGAVYDVPEMDLAADGSWD